MSIVLGEGRRRIKPVGFFIMGCGWGQVLLHGAPPLVGFALTLLGSWVAFILGDPEKGRAK